MNEQFRVAQKIGLMFRPGTNVPKDIKVWAFSQLHVNSPALKVHCWSTSCSSQIFCKND